ncbi:MAG: nucleoside phosphorylase [Flavobacteriales bacterium]|nr:nucleoside phosphorylase [Flavobacteriales bacterium]MBT5090259.1 nucleoside phosphorylase [Flavobacteriales bacterium]MBT5750070.1 nucleoside phosphorylase [Flavobacteriales bacterium]
MAETELILTAENKIYHLNLSKDEIADDIILVGDPDRVSLISYKFDRIEHKIQNREFVTHTGILNGKRISAIATGIGPDNIDIVVNELDALVNIDFKTRTINMNKKTLNLIRLGTSGSLQQDIEVDSFLLSSFGLGLDNIAHFYESKEIIEQEMSSKYKQHASWPGNLSNPYIVKASDKLLSLFPDIKKGITATAPGFYGPQGRTLRLNPNITNLHEKMESFNYKENRITNFEMETSALYYLGKSLGHNTLTICAIIANRLTKEYSKDYKKTVEKMIDLVLKRIC